MSTITLNFSENVGKMKPMHAVNNGPIGQTKVDMTASDRGNFGDFAALKIPYVRNHDASFCEDYGGEHIVDVHAIFPDFSKNPYNPNSYDFQLTDEYIQTIIDAGSSVFYRLGSKIEHGSKKYGTIVPADFNKWAVICEHIIRHYNEGWANGFHHNIIYWEIWNEADGGAGTGHQPNWSGTPAQFYELYATTATHLKKCFPNLKIGGPAISVTPCEFNAWWMEDFLKVLKKDGKKVPMDFFSWHCYNENPYIFGNQAITLRKYLDNAGYTETELILNEWNYLINFGDKFVESIENIISMRGAALIAAAMCYAQSTPMDMFMYYDFRPSVFNGAFDFYTLRPIKGYYSFLMFSKVYEQENQIAAESDDKDIIVCAAKGEKELIMITHYGEEKNAAAKTVNIKGLKSGEYTAEWLDNHRTMQSETIAADNGELSLNIPGDCIVLLTK